MQKIDVLLLDGTGACPTGATIDVFEAANRALGARSFDLRFVAMTNGVRTRGGLSTEATPFSRARARPIVIVLGLGVFTEEDVEARLARPDARAAAQWLARAAARGSTIAASCTGTFLLGEAGLLTGRRCVTTWWLGTALARRHPQCRVEIDRMVIRDRELWTAGSAFAHVDLIFGLLGSLVEPRILEEVASRLVFDTRPSQASFMISSHLASRDEQISALESHIRARVAERHTLESLAAYSKTSPRTLARRTQTAIGMSPLALVRRVRLERAVHLLRSTRLSLEAVAAEIGIDDPATFHRMVKRSTGLAPGALRIKKSSPSLPSRPPRRSRARR